VKHPYVVGGLNGFDPQPEYATLLEAAEAVRVANGWADVHLSDEGATTIALVPTWTAYPTQEARLQAEGIDPAVVLAPHIYRMV